MKYLCLAVPLFKKAMDLISIIGYISIYIVLYILYCVVCVYIYEKTNILINPKDIFNLENPLSFIIIVILVVGTYINILIYKYINKKN